MPTDTKPSKNEDEYFARENAELIRQLRTQRDRERETAERAAQRMRCPRCGGRLAERSHHHVTIDVCPDCGGTWLDKGELEMLEHVDKNAFRRFIGDLLGLKE